MNFTYLEFSKFYYQEWHAGVSEVGVLEGEDFMTGIPRAFDDRTVAAKTCLKIIISKFVS